MANTFSDYIFYVSFYLMGIAVLVAKKSRDRIDWDGLQTPDNLMNTRIVLYVLIFPVLFYFRG